MKEYRYRKVFFIFIKQIILRFFKLFDIIRVLVMGQIIFIEVESSEIESLLFFYFFIFQEKVYEIIIILKKGYKIIYIV